MFLYACACLREIAPVPMIPTRIRPLYATDRCCRLKLDLQHSFGLIQNPDVPELRRHTVLLQVTRLFQIAHIIGHVGHTDDSRLLLGMQFGCECDYRH